MNLYIRELRVTRKSLMIWTIGSCFLIASGMGKYSGFAEQGDAINDLLSSMPEALRGGMGLEVMNLTNVLDFYAYLFNYVLLFSGIYAMRLGMTIITKEEGDRTIEFLATKPIKRSSIINHKLLAATTNIIIMDTVIVLISLAMINVVALDPYDSTGIWLHLVTLFFFEWIYLTLGSFISVFMNNTKKATSLSLGFVFGGYLLSIITGMVQDIAWIKYLTPFKYYESIEVFRNGLPDIKYFIISLVIVVFSVVCTYKIYERKEFKV